MNNLITLILVLFISLSSYVKEKTPTTSVNNPVDASIATNRLNSTFGNGPYGSVNGTAKIYFQNNQCILALGNFNSSNGPDLHVYISKEAKPVNYIDLGKLQSISGNQQYPITGTINFSEYKYTLIHYQQYNHLFGSPELK